MLLPLLLVVLAQAGQPAQPIAYSHKLHAGALKLKCALCHTNPDPGEMMRFPPVATCMSCHSSIRTESPEIQKLAAYSKDGKSVKWVRVYQIPGYVNFSHRSHLETGSVCSDCHANVPDQTVISKQGDISMGACMNCHRLKKASTDCLYCHEQRQ